MPREWLTVSNIDSARLDGASLGLASLRLRDFKKQKFVGSELSAARLKGALITANQAFSMLFDKHGIVVVDDKSE